MRGHNPKWPGAGVGVAVLPISGLMAQSRVLARTLGRAVVRSYLFPLVLLLLAASVAMPSMAAAQNGGVGGEGDF